MLEKQTPETFIVTLKGVGVDIEREVNASKLAQIMSVIMGIDPPEGNTVQVPSASNSAGPVKVSLREFLDAAKATTKPDQIVAIGQYMAVHEGSDTFSRDDIKARFQSARERPPSNFPRDFGVAISKALIAEDHVKRGVYYVTKTGAQAVERRFGAQN